MSNSPHKNRNSSGECAASPIDRVIATLAERQHGVVTRPQLRGIGLSDDEIDYRITVGRLRPLYRGVYAVGHDRLTPEGRWLAAVFAGGDGAVLSHRSAGRLWDLMRYDGRVEVSVARRRRRRQGVRFIESRVEPTHSTVHDGIPVTTVARTLFDLGTVRGAGVAKAFEQADLLGLLDVVELQGLIDAHPLRPGTHTIRAVMAASASWRGITRSELEARFRALVIENGLPAPHMNLRVELGSFVIEADAVWQDARLIVELDGYAFHRSAAAFERDRERDRAAVAAGWRVIRITWRQISTTPRQVIRDLRAALAVRSPQ